MNAIAYITLATALTTIPVLATAADDQSAMPESSAPAASKDASKSMPANAGSDQSSKTTTKVKHAITDSRITTVVKAKLLKNSDTHAMDIHVTTKNGIVTLDGEAKSEQEKQTADKIARRVEGVRNVHNHLKVAG